jgi:hypothetical protein
LNDIPIKVATKTVREVSTACCWGGTYTLLFVIIQYSIIYKPILPSIIARLLRQDETVEVVDDDTMLLVDFQAQVSGDGGLNDIPIKVATKTVRELSTACRWGGHTLFCLLLTYEPILPSIISLLLLLGSNPFHESGR